LHGMPVGGSQQIEGAGALACSPCRCCRSSPHWEALCCTFLIHDVHIAHIAHIACAAASSASSAEAQARGVAPQGLWSGATAARQQRLWRAQPASNQRRQPATATPTTRGSVSPPGIHSAGCSSRCCHVGSSRSDGTGRWVVTARLTCRRCSCSRRDGGQHQRCCLGCLAPQVSPACSGDGSSGRPAGGWMQRLYPARAATPASFPPRLLHMLQSSLPPLTAQHILLLPPPSSPVTFSPPPLSLATATFFGCAGAGCRCSSCHWRHAHMLLLPPSPSVAAAVAGCAGAGCRGLG
jgi:hypothetical protein